MSRGLTFALDQLRPEMRAQVQRKLDMLRAISGERVHVCQDDGVVDGVVVPVGPKASARSRTHRPTQIPRLSNPEDQLAFYLRADGLGGFERQYRWCPGRAYRADFAYIGPKLLIEVQGGLYVKGAHTRGSGYEYDRMRANEAVILGWRVLEFSPRHIKSGHAVRTIRRALEALRT